MFALNDRCPHRGALLSRGRLEGDAVRCMYHGIKYDGRGKCVQIPGQDMIPPTLRVPAYPVVERGHFIWIWMGEAAKADPALIVDRQQQTLDEDPNFQMLAILADAPLAHFRRVLGKLMTPSRRVSGLCPITPEAGFNISCRDILGIHPPDLFGI